MTFDIKPVSPSYRLALAPVFLPQDGRKHLSFALLADDKPFLDKDAVARTIRYIIGKYETSVLSDSDKKVLLQQGEAWRATSNDILVLAERIANEYGGKISWEQARDCLGFSA